MPRRKTVRYAIPPEIFCQIYQDSKTVDECRTRLSAFLGQEVPRQIILTRASNYRRKKIQLKKMPREVKNRLNVENLNNLINGEKKNVG